VAEDDNSQTVAKPALEPVTADELIDDRALISGEQDAFRLTDFVQELAQLCRVTPTPANVALYGAWGSGKSSLGNLLEATVKADGLVTFGRFDAFKFAEVPLRRHFLASVADWFKIDDPAYSEDLYRETKEQRFRLTRRGALELVGAIALAAVGLALIMALAALAIAAISAFTAPFWKSYVLTLRASAPGILIAAPIVGGVLAMAFKRFQIDTITSAPFSDEEFERLFKKLVKAIQRKTGKERVLIFIDELDRCSPKQVGSVLETLRTFLDVPSCIFIVAADQQVLEHALTEGGARQSTPTDSANPYYSSGTAYLDKIFHQQIPLPPLLPRTLSQFALGLIKSRGGVWERVPNRAELVSVLVPTHVRSPRRVKTLLNTFASLYRLAVLRGEDGALDEEVQARASEIGKLVCLRTEFPLFARDLSLDARLPEIVLTLYDNPDATLESLKMSGLSSEIFHRAKAYSVGTLPVADLLSYASGTQKGSGGGGAPVEPTDADANDAEDDTSAADVEDSGAAPSVQQAYARQLIRYLQRTKSIPGPRRDLIYLESSGLAFGLPAEFADRLEDDARDGRAAEVAAQVAALEPGDQLAACRLLAQVIAEGSVGLETPNVVRSLFAAANAAKGGLGEIADDLLTVLANYAAGYQLDPGDLKGALLLALASEGPAAHVMRATILGREELVSEQDLGLVALNNAETLAPSFSQRLSLVFAARLGETPTDDLVASLVNASDATVSQITAGVPDPTEAETELPADLRAFADAALTAGRVPVAGATFDRLLALDSTEARNEARSFIEKLAPITDEARARAVLAAVPRRVLSDWPRWLNHVANGSLRISDNSDREVVNTALTKIWTERFAPVAVQPTPPTADDFSGAVKALAAVSDELPLRGDAGLAETLAATAPSPVTTEPEVTLRAEQHAALYSFASAGLVGEREAASVVLGDLSLTLAASVAAQPNALVTWVTESSVGAMKAASVEAINSFREAAATSTWLDEGTRVSLQMIAAAAQHSLDTAASASLPAEGVAELLASGAPLAGEAVGRWIEEFKPGADEILAALRTHADAGELTPRLHAALGVLADGWAAEEKTAVFEILAPSFVSGDGSDALLRDLRMGGADQDRVAKTLVKLFGDAGSNPERERVLQLWEIAQPSSQNARRALVEGVFIPLIKGGKGQAKLALDHFSLVANSVGKPTKAKIKQAFDVVAAGEKDLQNRVNRVLQGAEWIKRPRRFKVF
jgi:hypothetical protein